MGGGNCPFDVWILSQPWLPLLLPHFVAENGQFGTPFLTPKTPLKKFMWVPLLRPFPGNEAHNLNFSGGAKWGVLGGGQQVYVAKIYALFFSPNGPIPV